MNLIDERFSRPDNLLVILYQPKKAQTDVIRSSSSISSIESGYNPDFDIGFAICRIKANGFPLTLDYCRDYYGMFTLSLKYHALE